jgi:hypothetical protein
MSRARKRSCQLQHRKSREINVTRNLFGIRFKGKNFGFLEFEGAHKYSCARPYGRSHSWFLLVWVSIQFMERNPDVSAGRFHEGESPTMLTALFTVGLFLAGLITGFDEAPKPWIVVLFSLLNIWSNSLAGLTVVAKRKRTDDATCQLPPYEIEVREGCCLLRNFVSAKINNGKGGHGHLHDRHLS